MTDPGYETLEANLTSNLKELDLTEYEANTLIALVRLGTGTAKDIANTGDVPRSRVYDAVETLQERGLVDIQYTTPRRYTIVSTESVVQMLDRSRAKKISEVAEDLEKLENVEPNTDLFGAWTVTGREAVKHRVIEFIDEAHDAVVYLSVEPSPSDEQLVALGDATERGVRVYVSDPLGRAKDRFLSAVPSATWFDADRRWRSTPLVRLLVADWETGLVSVRREPQPDTAAADVGETAIWAQGEGNCLVVLLRVLSSWELDSVATAGELPTDSA